MESLFQNVLVPIDGSEPSLEAVRMALRVIRFCPPCKMTVLYVIGKLVLAERVRFSKRTKKEVEVEFEEQGRRYLELARKQAEQQGVSAECQLRKGYPFDQIVLAAKDLRADLIIMGHTGRRGATRVLIGSVTQRVLDYAPCPVLVISKSSPQPGQA
jgi:nucleotide-binding universal stress UspA family protein